MRDTRPGSGRRTVRLMSDYSVGRPLWDGEGAMDPAASGVSADLAARVYAWQQSSEEDFHYARGWRAAGKAAAYAREGRVLQGLLSAEIGSWAEIELDLWPVPAALQ